MNTTTNPYHAHIAELEQQGKHQALITVESIRAAKSDLKAAAEAIVRAEIAAAETQRLLDKFATELDIQPVLKYIHETLAAR